MMVRNYKKTTVQRWTNEDLLNALVEIKDEHLKINAAVNKFGISRATLYRQFKKFLWAGGLREPTQFKKCGNHPILSPLEENVFVDILIRMKEQHFLITGERVRQICFEYCDTNGISNQFNKEKRIASADWFYGFCKRHPEVKTLVERRVNMNKERKDFEQVEEKVTQNNETTMELTGATLPTMNMLTEVTGTATKKNPKVKHFILSPLEEKLFVDVLMDLKKQNQNVIITGVNIRQICFDYCDTNGIVNRFNKEKRIASLRWFDGFCKRHPEVYTLIVRKAKKEKNNFEPQVPERTCTEDENNKAGTDVLELTRTLAKPTSVEEGKASKKKQRDLKRDQAKHNALPEIRKSSRNKGLEKDRKKVQKRKKYSARSRAFGTKRRP